MSRHTEADRAAAHTRRGRNRQYTQRYCNMMSCILATARQAMVKQQCLQCAPAFFNLGISTGVIYGARAGLRNDRAIWRHDYDFSHDFDTL
jgi:hypothetical protein